MFVLICPHCNKEVNTRVARHGATVKCMSCQQTYVLGNLNVSEIPDPPPPPEFEETPDPHLDSTPADSKVALAAIHAMAQDLPAPEPRVAISGRISGGDAAGKLTKLALAIALLVAIIAAAVWLMTPAAKPPAKPPSAPAAPQTPANGTTPASEF